MSIVKLLRDLNRRTLLSGALALPLAACNQEGGPPQTSVPAGPITTPTYSDPLAGLFNMPASAVPNDVPVDYYSPTAQRAPRSVLTMALVPGANFGRVRRYHQALAAQSGSNSAAARDLDISPVLRQAVDQLKTQYPWLELMDDVAAAQEKNVSLTIVFDIRSVLGTSPGTTTLVQIDCIVFDDQRKPISRLAVEGSAIVTSSNGNGFQEAAGEALARLASKAKVFLT